MAELEDRLRSDRPAVIAEIGVNHDGSLDRAHALVDLAASAGAHAVKFQAFRPELMCRPDAPAASYQAAQGFRAGQYEMLASLALPDTAWQEIASHAHEAGIAFGCTAFDQDSFDLIKGFIDFAKVPSGEVDNHPLLRHVASGGRPIIVSSGASYLTEVLEAVRLIAAEGGEILAVMHCISAYPAPASELNLRAIVALGDALDLAAPGWSDHSSDGTSALVALGLGARCFERHLTYDRYAQGPDHSASSDAEQFASYVRALDRASTMLGTGIKEPSPSELENRPLIRKGAYATRQLSKDSTLGAEDVVFQRPQAGLPPTLPIIGSRVLRNISPGDAISEADLEL